MGLQFPNLDEDTRSCMLTEIEHDESSGKLYISNRLNYSGRERWAEILKSAAQHHNDDWLAQQLRSLHLLETSEPRRLKSGAYTTASVPTTAAQTLAEGEFNRFYIRAICLRAISTGQTVVVYRAKMVDNPRAESESKIGLQMDPAVLVEDLRSSSGFKTSSGFPGPNSGLSVHL
ncbi:hypothetical protein TSACC_21404 [Terrimicrobium sacchariphilum]|uniref:Uncharacterized protein n=1 Tax=Terrimicrobium sacchariphilum TaxID=690879 RepID=A0A146G5A9_TERSA|nr:hypothetical protein TSACC_21404 [Terrimicrobium sacchariphilum]